MNSSEKTSSRSKSTRITRDAEATKLQILDAAEIEFAQHGLHGTRVDAIAERAGVAPRMIYYYFENKDGLYQAVLQRPATLLHNVFRELSLDRLPPDRALSLLIRATIEYETSNRCRGMLLFQEAIQNQGKYFKLTNWQEPISLLAAILERGMQLGIFKQMDVQMTTLNIIGICTVYANAYENVKHLDPEQDFLSQEMIERYTQTATQLVLNGVHQK
ncbi:TetR family transcriptional regulator [Scytonema sp. UIC 10036]|uniref:TetR/AcrR family transcriptional regulator n=1 Tax=Scytonema sp. UIC 10036 TaxID=2304196 RepID=UPI0012DA0C08|nr:TetR/AcrR family transcriptional regulator [Scytonema sp. UIC 10036]MUG98617.1 TetR family transcriptional regulator [Scytonema sp. UIC 10036]